MIRRIAVFAIASGLLAVQYQGSVMAPVKVEVYSDYSCPHCRAFHEDAVRPLIEDYVSKNKVQLIHRDYLLGHFKYSHEAAVYANAAAKINKFVAVSDALWAQQPSWTQNGNVDGCVASVLSPAEMEKLRKLVKDPQSLAAIEAGIKADMEMAAKLPLTETPTVVITLPHEAPVKVGGISYDLLKRFIAGTV
jgi:protein-disulfide isomerase